MTKPRIYARAGEEGDSFEEERSGGGGDDFTAILHEQFLQHGGDDGALQVRVWFYCGEILVRGSQVL